jgi:hypothetical protein
MPPLLLDLVCEAVAGGLCQSERDLLELLRALERLTATTPLTPLRLEAHSSAACHAADPLKKK